MQFTSTKILHKVNLYRITLLLIFFLFMLTPVTELLAQTPGLIYKPATSGGNNVLDPNNDGYISVPRVPPGFADTRDEGTNYSEITYRPFPALTNEPLGDLNTGASGGHTDLAPPNYSGSTGSPIAAFYNGTHVMFRVRLGNSSTASKGYSVMIDSNNQFGNLVEGNNPATTPNPGFEYEVVFASNFDVSLYDHRGKASGGSKVWTGSVEQFSQRAVAASTSGGDPDYFYDFYVPLSAFPKTGADLVTADTPLRFSGITITSAQSGISGTVSDVGGVNFAAYDLSKQKAWADVINTFPATSLNQLRNGGFGKLAATAPVVNPVILANATSVSGTSVELSASVITVYKSVSSGSPTIIGTTTVNADGSWILPIAGSDLAAGNVVTATVTPTTKNVSPASASVIVEPGICVSPPPPTITEMGGTGNKSRSFIGTTTYTSRIIVTVYDAATDQPLSADPFYFDPATQGSTWTTPEYAVGDNSNYYATITPVDASGNVTGCTSLKSNQVCFSNGQPGLNNQTVTITSVTYNGVTQNSSTNATWDEIPTNVTSISGTLGAAPSGGTGGYLTLFINAVEQTSLLVNITSSSTTWTITIPENHSPALKAGDEIYVRSVWTVSGGGQTTCPAPSTPSNLLAVLNTTAAPSINSITSCGTVKSLTGTSTEPAGTVLQFYINGTAGQRNGTLITPNGSTTPITAIVTTRGTWSVDFSSVTAGGIAAETPITARAKATGKVRSINSNSVSSTAALSVPDGSTFTIDTVQEPLPEQQLVTISGTGPASNATTTYQVTVSIAGTLFPTVATTTSGTWQLSGISPLEIYAGATVSATFKTSASTCSSEPVTTTVQCQQLNSGFSTALASNSICYNGTVTVTLSGSEKGVSYRLTNNGTPTGASVLGTGSSITLTSGQLTASTTSLSVRAIRVGSSCVATDIGGNKTVTVEAQPTQPTSLVASTTSGCSAVTTNIVLNEPTAGFTYQLINLDTKAAIGSVYTAPSTSPPASVTLVSNQTFYSTTNLGVLITPTGASPCTSESIRTATVTVTEGPLLQRSVTINKPTPCPGEQVTISVATEYNSDYIYVIKDDLDNTIGETFTGIGGVVSRTTAYSGGVTAARTFRVEVTGGCATNAILATTVTATPSTTPVAATTGPDRTVCGTVSLDGNYASPGVGTWTKVGGPAGGTITNPNDPKTTVTGLPSGAHTFRWTIETSCGQQDTVTSFKEVQITINCPAQYVVSAPKYTSEYNSGDILASATDSDGDIYTSSLVSGTMPSWALLQPNGNIVLRTGATPVAGSYLLRILTTDAADHTTESPVTLTVYGEEPTLQPLPVELVYFTATVNDGYVQLQWLTASEENNDRFEIERSINGKVFEKIGSVKGKGNSHQDTKYNFTDDSPITGTVYYRLKQVDLDKVYVYSKIISVNSEGIANKMLLQAYPNPFSSALHVTVTVSESGEAALQLFDLQTKEVYRKHVNLETGINTFVLPQATLKSGVYILKLTGKQVNATTKVVKVE